MYYDLMQVNCAGSLQCVFFTDAFCSEVCKLTSYLVGYF